MIAALKLRHLRLAILTVGLALCACGISSVEMVSHAAPEQKKTSRDKRAAEPAKQAQPLPASPAAQPQSAPNANAHAPAGDTSTAPITPFGPPPPPEVWSPDQIKEAAAECSSLFRDKPFSFKALPPIRDGVCGAPAPIKLQGFSSEPAFEIRPAAITTCKMTMALHEWMTKVVQPRAKELLHANIIRISNVASYDCRHRYNNPLQRMSNHAFASALDISEFLTAKGERINILEHWPLDDERSKFLKDIHKGACEIFGTTLGPEANEAHRNHFHLDAQVRRKPFCDGVKGKDEKESADIPQQPIEKASGAPATRPKNR